MPIAEVRGYPTTVLVGRDGRILDRQTGFGAEFGLANEERLKELLANP